MKILRRNSMQRLMLVAVLGIGLSLAFSTNIFAASTRSYIVDLNSKTVTDLGTLGGISSNASAINDAGQVVGQSDTASGETHAFITGPNGVGMTDLGANTDVTGINDAGQVVGVSSAAGGFITGPNGVGMTFLRTLAGAYFHPTGINNSGQVVGESYTAAGTQHAFITGPNGVGMTDLGTLGGNGSGNRSYAVGINDSGQVGGWSYTTQNVARAFITGPNGVGMTDQGMLGGSYSFASAINNSGQVAGTFGAATGVNGQHTFITGPNGMGMTDLGSFSFKDRINGINDIGQIVGGSEVYQRAFITGPNGVGMIDLNSLVSLPGVTFTNVMAINNHGQVVVRASVVPEPETYALMLAGLGLVGWMARRKKISATGFSLA